ncbi:MAG: hypothetical protein E4G98_05345 [Promethearchaeota archaeon]|nr:MAG: hypothetical protein E4G98_05345 [Candidatus Lokiarchaeota archaeon]
MELETNWNMNMGYETIPSYLEDMIDEAVRQDFVDVFQLSKEDLQHDMYKAIKFSLNAARVELLYERRVISKDTLSLVIPHEQFLFGFRPTDGLCIFSQKDAHKEMLCDGPVRELATECPLTQSLQYILVPLNDFQVWSYIPVCCSGDESCPLKTRPFDYRRDLFS